MTVTNTASGTNIHEIADDIFRINTPVDVLGGFSFNQYLIVDRDPLLFHTGPRRMFGLVSEAVANVLPCAKLRYVAFSHFEADECGSLNDWLSVAPDATAVCSQLGVMLSVDDTAIRPGLGLADGATLELGRHTVKWLDTPHLPHGWETGYMMELTTRTLFCGDLFTQGGRGEAPLIETDILGPSETFRQPLDYFSHTRHVLPLIEKLAVEEPAILACMHGSAWRGDGASLLRALGQRLAAS